MKSPTRVLLSTLAAALLLALGGVAAASQLATVETPEVEPVFVEGNPTCADLAPPGVYWQQLKVDPPSEGTFSDGYLSVTVSNFDGTYFDWSATKGIDAVFAKGGPAGNLYQYDPPAEATGGEGLHSPVNPSGGPAGLSHILFCYDIELEVSKTAATSLTRTYDWSIDKSVDKTSLELDVDDSATVNYTVTVDADYTDSDWAVEGEITIRNPAPVAAQITAVADTISGVSDEVEVDCGVTFPYQLAAGETLRCSYEATLPDGAARTNTATVTTSASAQFPVGGNTATAAVDFSAATVTEVSKCADVSDTYKGDLGEVCYDPDKLPYEFKYSREVSPDECEDYTVENTATVTWGETDESTASASADVEVHVTCGNGGDDNEGCTYTPGYWKTHSKYGPVPAAKQDSTWEELPDGPDTPFFSTGNSWYQMLWAPPRGDAYIILARAYIAARLNDINGAGVPGDVVAALAHAEDLLEDYSPGNVPKGKKSDFTRTASILDAYNNGEMGVPHCGDDDSNDE